MLVFYYLFVPTLTAFLRYTAFLRVP